MTGRRFDRRSFSIIACAAVLGALWAGFNLWRAGDARDDSVFRALIWVVFATPFATFWGWILARPHERWRAAFVCFTIYFFAIFTAARIERLVLGQEAASATGHALYFRLTLLFDLLGCLGVALHRARSLGTIASPAESVARSTPSQH
jgi:succinate-acetate transporter protein